MKIQLNQAYSFCQQGTRDYQEDCRFPNTDKPDKKQRFFLVCDGVGGCNKGEVASQTVCEAFGKALGHQDFDEDFTNQDFTRALDAAYDALDKKSNRSNEGMATTMTFVCFHQGGCTMAHIGDSRIYHIRSGEGILYRSDDHSLVNELVHNGVITPDEAVNHPKHNVITRYMESVKADEYRCMATLYRTIDIKPGDYFFLCSDGVLHCVSDDELFDVLADESISDEEKMSLIAEKSFDSSDNNTAYLISIAGVEDIIESDQVEMQEDLHRTVRMSSRRYGSEEIESVQRNDNGRGLKQWFKHLFNKKR